MGTETGDGLTLPRRVTTPTVTLETCGTQLSVQMQPHVPKTVLLTVSTLQLGMAPMELKSLTITHYLSPSSQKDLTPETLDPEPSFWTKAWIIVIIVGVLDNPHGRLHTSGQAIVLNICRQFQLPD